jgi:hypothetical protein
MEASRCKSGESYTFITCGSLQTITGLRTRQEVAILPYAAILQGKTGRPEQRGRESFHPHSAIEERRYTQEWQNEEGQDLMARKAPSVRQAQTDGRAVIMIGGTYRGTYGYEEKTGHQNRQNCR